MSTNTDDLKKRKAEEDSSLSSDVNKKIKEDESENESEKEDTNKIDDKNLPLPMRLKALKASKKVLSDPICTSGNGLIFTFGNGREKQASKDINKVLDEYIDKFKDIAAETKKKANSDDFDFDSAFQAELQQIKESSGSKSKYVKYTLKCNGVAYMSLNSGINPIELTSKIFKDAQDTKALKSKEINRIIPIQKTCHLSNIFEETQSLVNQYFNVDNKVYKYKIEFKSRMNNKINKVEYIQELAKLVDPKHIVDLDNPELTIIVEIVNFYCFLSIVSNYNQCKRFNLILLAGLPASNEPKKNKKVNESKETESTTEPTINESKE
ncbi:hypothetical protein DICPUDRAFT_148721 [Dictyostelium purpureum]|uniref:THUMP domain-containing protein n=1 Tax=Dictyostelium purpureum TaxID=5786 RepID=F0ZBU0_DICPU|nr:uncharacterized protein DICPUDRAFT_148721 [Dictyostelium purpureum]EGC38612.1 hypothetical protein DICPUDRAFT_148721 [Dictyostelium purpureum]|eukprot:XP_003284891.1 hypothetical protein DICPUDRAFT_148721 [Dictyostelium purpureum]